MSGPINDVDAHLQEMRLLAQAVVTNGLDGEALADLVLELHEHLRKGGKLPAVWSIDAKGRVRG